MLTGFLENGKSTMVKYWWIISQMSLELNLELLINFYFQVRLFCSDVLEILVATHKKYYSSQSGKSVIF